MTNHTDAEPLYNGDLSFNRMNVAFVSICSRSRHIKAFYWICSTQFSMTGGRSASKAKF